MGMSNYTIVLGILSALWLFLCVRVLARDRKRAPYTLFAGLCACMVLWNLFLGISYSLEDLDLIVLFLQIAYIGAFLFSPVTLHFYAEISGIRLNLRRIAVSYLPSVILLVSNFIRFFVFSRFEKRNGEWFGILNAESWWVRAYILIVIATYAASIAVLVRWNIRTRINKEKAQSRHLILFFTATYFTSLILTLILPYFGFSDWQHIGISIFSLYILGLYFLITRFSFMNMKGGLSMNEVIVHVDELVFILDRDLRIGDCSGSVDRRFPEAAKGLRNRSFTEIVSADKTFADKVALLSEGKIRSFSAPVSFSVDKESLAVRVHITELRDRFGDYSGFLAMASEKKEADQLRKRFGLTKREIEVIRLVVSGVTYRGIAEQLGISEKTVERHLTNIYNKVGVSNKLALFKVVGEYGVRP